ncbi:hypothetical protein AAG570_011796 [Ranatra chinensis]|uniref:Uncharacterized protein n=1 Tax=Ranatra chinensis TaxID=642074 RepID=A0ABD0YGY5_9HEMI
MLSYRDYLTENVYGGVITISIGLCNSKRFLLIAVFDGAFWVAVYYCIVVTMDYAQTAPLNVAISRKRFGPTNSDRPRTESFSEIIVPKSLYSLLSVKVAQWHVVTSYLIFIGSFLSSAYPSLTDSSASPSVSPFAPEFLSSAVHHLRASPSSPSILGVIALPVASRQVTRLLPLNQFLGFVFSILNLISHICYIHILSPVFFVG